MASVAEVPTPIQQLGERIIQRVVSVGDAMLFVCRMLTWMTRRPCAHTLTTNFYQIGVRSIPVVALTGTFIGMVLAEQTNYQFKSWNMENLLGSVINMSLVSELGPVLAATMLAGRIGSSMAAEIGTMRVTEQIDALHLLGTNPIHYLVVPRFLACVILIPLLTIMADFMGIIGGALYAIHGLHIDAFYYWKHSQATVGMWDVFSGIFKSLFFGAEIAIISCYRGFNSGAGAEGVGRSATDAFVYSFIAILVSDFFLGKTLNATYFWLWPHRYG